MFQRTLVLLLVSAFLMSAFPAGFAATTVVGPSKFPAAEFLPWQELDDDQESDDDIVHWQTHDAQTVIWLPSDYCQRLSIDTSDDHRSHAPAAVRGRSPPR
jgi:hypothetical protein